MHYEIRVECGNKKRQIKRAIKEAVGKFECIFSGNQEFIRELERKKIDAVEFFKYNISFLVTDSDGIRSVNKKFAKSDSAPVELTFPYGRDELTKNDLGESVAADIVINLDGTDIHDIHRVVFHALLNIVFGNQTKLRDRFKRYALKEYEKSS